MAHAQFDIIPSHDINVAKWDNCIINSEANKIYARHIYLQHLADNWSGLVMNDYAAVMPVVWRKKWSIRYAYNAPFIQQLGLFGTYNADELAQAIEVAIKYIKYGDLYFNHTNALQPFLPSARAATNLIIPLHTGYEKINKNYNSHLKNKLKKAATQSLRYLVTDNIELAVNTYQQLYAQRFPSVTTNNYQKLINVAKQLYNQQQCFVRQVVDKENNLQAIALFFKDENRIYNILPSTTTQGRKVSAMHFLIDNVIKEFTGAPLIFDFEGSDVPGIKMFYQSFGAVDELYFHLHYNHLPIPVKWLKR
jgi:hypothetical protein